MRYKLCDPRKDWRKIVAKEGLVFNHVTEPNGLVRPYWCDSAFISMSAEEQAVLEEATRVVYKMYYWAGEHIIANPDVMSQMGIPESCFDLIYRSWKTSPLNIYGRFDFRYGGYCQQAKEDPTLLVPKLLEFNGQTPTSLLESAVTQWHWHLQTGIGTTQWNNIDDMLKATWQRQIPLFEQQQSELLGKDYKLDCIYFAYSDKDKSGEDLMNVTYMADTAERAGYPVEIICIEDIVRHNQNGTYHSGAGHPEIKLIFMLYPWEWAVHDDAGPQLLENMARPTGTTWIESLYKMIWSNKASLPVLWKLFGEYPEYSKYLLPAFFDSDNHDMRDFVIKPYMSREGANIKVVRNGKVGPETPGEYGEEGYIHQQYAELPDFRTADGDDHYVMTGAWVIDGDPAGAGFRVNKTIITDNLSQFVPHAIED